jgi:hypothetical protein
VSSPNETVPTNFEMVMIGNRIVAAEAEDAPVDAFVYVCYGCGVEMGYVEKAEVMSS